MKNTNLQSSASALLKAGIESYQRQDLQHARIWLGLAEKMFTDSSDVCSAEIAHGWYRSALRKLGVSSSD